MKSTIKTENELPEMATKILERMGDNKLLLLVGDLGAGKTTFVKHAVKELGVEIDISSPTFSIVNEYPVRNGDGKVFHIDLYRLKTLQEALDIGIEEYLYSGYFCFIEWPQVIEAILLDNFNICKIQIEENGERTFEIS